MPGRTYPPRLCPTCCGARNVELYRQSFEGMSGNTLLRGYVVVACDVCGFCYADDVPEQAAFDRYYRDASKYEHADTAGAESPHDRRRFEEYAGMIRQFVPSPDARIVEIGCATGGLLNALRDLGFNRLAGIDPSPGCAAAAHRLYGLPVTAATLDTIKPEQATCDFLILIGVLEHVRDLDAAFRKLQALVPLGGRAYVEVPDASRYAEGKDAPFQEFSLEHVNYFGPTSLANLMGRYGFGELGHRQGMVEFSHGTFTPVLHGAFEHDGVARLPNRDVTTVADLAAYVRKSADEDRSIQNVIAAIAAKGESILVWGTGAHTLRLLATSRLGDANVVAYVDSNPKYQGQTLGGVPIIAPADVRRHAAPILVSSRTRQAEIVATVREELRLVNPVITLYQLSCAEAASERSKS